MDANCEHKLGLRGGKNVFICNSGTYFLHILYPYVDQNTMCTAGNMEHQKFGFQAHGQGSVGKHTSTVPHDILTLLKTSINFYLQYEIYLGVPQKKTQNLMLLSAHSLKMECKTCI